MGRIHVLSENVVNKIAAGEVVERPASVVKELLENSLDAGATRIRIEVEAGGRKLIRIVDNGHGMIRADALLALRRTAPSTHPPPRPFYKHPPPRKILKSEQTELAHIAALVPHYALAHPERHFEL